MESVIKQIAKALTIIFLLIYLVIGAVFGAPLSIWVACLLPIAWLLGLHRLVRLYGRKDTQHYTSSAWIGKHPNIATVIFYSVPIVILSVLFKAFDALLLGIEYRVCNSQ